MGRGVATNLLLLFFLLSLLELPSQAKLYNFLYIFFNYSFKRFSYQVMTGFHDKKSFLEVKSVNTLLNPRPIGFA